MHVGQAMTREEMIDEAVRRNTDAKYRKWIMNHELGPLPPYSRRLAIRTHFTRIAAREAKT